MPVIRCTSKLLAEIDDPPTADSAVVAPSLIGDWYGNIFTIERRKCILFINEPTLFVCLSIGVTKVGLSANRPVVFSTFLNEHSVKRDSTKMRLHGFSACIRTWRLANPRIAARLPRSTTESPMPSALFDGMAAWQIAMSAH